MSLYGYEVTQVDGKNTSMITGKTWNQMNEAERNAHQVMRGTAAPTEEGQAWLDANVGSAQDQTNLAVESRQAAAQRIADGTFSDQATATQLHQAQLLSDVTRGATQGSELTLGGFGPSVGSPASTGVYDPRDPVDMSGYQDLYLGEATGDNIKTGSEDGVWTLWNPETNTYEQYASDPNDRFNFNPRGDVTSWYFNENGDHVLGIKPSNYTVRTAGDYQDVYELADGVGGMGGGSTVIDNTTDNTNNNNNNNGSTNNGGVFDDLIDQGLSDDNGEAIGQDDGTVNDDTGESNIGLGGDRGNDRGRVVGSEWYAEMLRKREEAGGPFEGGSLSPTFNQTYGGGDPLGIGGTQNPYGGTGGFGGYGGGGPFSTEQGPMLSGNGGLGGFGGLGGYGGQLTGNERPGYYGGTTWTQAQRIGNPSANPTTGAMGG